MSASQWAANCLAPSAANCPDPLPPTGHATGCAVSLQPCLQNDKIYPRQMRNLECPIWSLPQKKNPNWIGTGGSKTKTKTKNGKWKSKMENGNGNIGRTWSKNGLWHFCGCRSELKWSKMGDWKNGKWKNNSPMIFSSPSTCATGTPNCWNT